MKTTGRDQTASLWSGRHRFARRRPNIVQHYRSHFFAVLRRSYHADSESRIDHYGFDGTWTAAAIGAEEAIREAGLGDLLEFDYEVEQDSDCLRFTDGPGWQGDWWELRVLGPFRDADEATTKADCMVERDTFSRPFE